jgi:hypothetical protein
MAYSQEFVGLDSLICQMREYALLVQTTNRKHRGVYHNLVAAKAHGISNTGEIRIEILIDDFLFVSGIYELPSFAVCCKRKLSFSLCNVRCTLLDPLLRRQRIVLDGVFQMALDHPTCQG